MPTRDGHYEDYLIRTKNEAEDASMRNPLKVNTEIGN